MRRDNIVVAYLTKIQKTSPKGCLQMKTRQTFSALLLVLILVLSLVFAFASCGESTENGGGDDTTETDGKKTYTVKVTDYLGQAPTSYVVVQIYSGEERVGMQNVNADGVATFELDAGEYTVVIDSPDASLAYDAEAAKLTADKTTAQIMIYNEANSEKKQTITVPDATLDMVEYGAVSIGEGATLVKIDRRERSYFLFTPTRGGIYRFAVASEDEIEIGYYGGIHFVMNDNVADKVDGELEIEIQDSSVNVGVGGTMQYVIGLTAPEGVDECVVTVTRIADAVKPIPFTEIYADPSLTKYDNLLNSSLVDIDITSDDLKAVYNETDGYYHLGAIDGPVILIKISAAGNSHVPGLILPSFVTICETDRMSKVFYDGDGNITYKESYNELIAAYADLSGSRGVRPLDKKIADAIKNTGDHKGWWNVGANGNQIFGDDILNVNLENAWLFACCYEVKDTYGAEDNPIVLSPVSQADSVELAAEIDESGTCFAASGRGTFAIENAEGVTVLVNGETVTPDTEGGISVVIDKGATFSVSIDRTEGAVIHFTFITAA